MHAQALSGVLGSLPYPGWQSLDNIASRQYQHEVRPLRLALDRWLHGLGFQDAGLSIRLVKASDLPPNSCGMSTYDLRSLVGEIDVLRSDEYANLPGCLDGVDVPRDQLNTVIHEVMHMVLDLHVSDEAKVVAISEVIQPRRRKRK